MFGELMRLEEKRTNMKSQKVSRMLNIYGKIKEVLAVLYFIFFVFNSVGIVMFIMSEPRVLKVLMNLLVLIFLLILSILLFVSGVVLWRGKEWGLRIALITNAVILVVSLYHNILLRIPLQSVGTVIYIVLGGLTVFYILCLMK